MLSGYLEASHAKVDVLGFHFVEQSENGVTAHDLPVEVVGFECLQLREAVLGAIVDLLTFDERLEFLGLCVTRRIIEFSFAFVLLPEHLEVHILRLHYTFF